MPYIHEKISDDDIGRFSPLDMYEKTSGKRFTNPRFPDHWVVNRDENSFLIFIGGNQEPPMVYQFLFYINSESFIISILVNVSIGDNKERCCTYNVKSMLAAREKPLPSIVVNAFLSGLLAWHFAGPFYMAKSVKFDL